MHKIPKKVKKIPLILVILNAVYLKNAYQCSKYTLLSSINNDIIMATKYILQRSAIYEEN